MSAVIYAWLDENASKSKIDGMSLREGYQLVANGRQIPIKLPGTLCDVKGYGDLYDEIASEIVDSGAVSFDIVNGKVCLGKKVIDKSPLPEDRIGALREGVKSGIEALMGSLKSEWKEILT